MSTLEKLLEQGRQQGRLEGTAIALEGIETALEIKFGAGGLSLMPEIRKITDLKRLTQVQQLLKQAKDIADFRKQLARLQQ